MWIHIRAVFAGLLLGFRLQTGPRLQGEYLRT